MAKNILIGVGGTGQHVVHAYLRFLRLTLPSPNQVPHIFIFDADANKSSPGRANYLIDDIEGLHKTLTEGAVSLNLNETLPPFVKGENVDARALGAHLNVADDNSLFALANAFLADDKEPAIWGDDWSVELRRGMMANPKVGALALEHLLQSKSDDLNKLNDSIESDVRVALAGSNFGGTGSGVIPALVRYLDKGAKADAIRAFVMLPWFKISDSSDTGVDKSAANVVEGVDPKERNASLALLTYVDDGAALNKSSYVLTQNRDGWSAAERIDDGNYNQRENVHVLNLVQATAIQSFFELGATAQVTPNSADKKLFAFEVDGLEASHGRFDPAVSDHLRFCAETDNWVQLKQLAENADVAAFVLDITADLFKAAIDGECDLRAQIKLSGDYLDKLFLEIGEKSGVAPAKAGGFFGIGKRDLAPKSVYTDVGNELAKCALELRQTLVWFDGHRAELAKINPAQATGVTGHAFGRLFSVERQGDEVLPPHRCATRSLAECSLAWSELTGGTIKSGGKVLDKSAPPRSQAFAILLELLHDAEGGKKSTTKVDNLIEAISASKKTWATASYPSVAAKVLAGRVLKRVAELRNGFAAKVHKSNREQATSDRKQPVAMLKVRAQRIGSATDSRLTGVDLTGPSDSGGPSELDPSHPQSLFYIDPYCSTRLRPVGEQLSFEHFTFPEHGLKGIPNAVAPFKLQQWRLKHRPGPHENDEQLYVKHRDGTIKTSKRGIYVHARRIVEAAFHVLLVNDPRVRFEPTLFSNNNRSHAFSKLVAGGLSIHSDKPNHIPSLPAVLFAEGEHAGKPIFVWTKGLWYLAANVAARKFFASLIADLPTVRYSYRSDNPLIRRPAPDAVRGGKALDKAFARQLDTIIESCRAEPQGTLLAEVLSDIRLELPKLDKPDDSIDTSEVPDDSGSFALPLGDQSLIIRPNRITGKIKEYLLPIPVAFVREKTKNWKDGRRPDFNNSGLLPIRGEAWAMLNPVQDYPLVFSPQGGKASEGAGAAVLLLDALALDIKGLGTVEFSRPFGDKPIPVISDEIEWSLGVWPNFKADGWNYYIVSGETDVRSSVTEPAANFALDRSRSKIELCVKGRPAGGGSFCELTRVRDGLPKRVFGVPEVLEVYLLRHDGDMAPMLLGSRSITLTAISGDASIRSIGLDFGTSNSCVAIAEIGETEAKAFPLSPGATSPRDGKTLSNLWLQLDSSEVKPNGTTAARARDKQSQFWFVKSAEVDASVTSSSVPSELLVALSEAIEVAEAQKERLRREGEYTAADGDAGVRGIGDGAERARRINNFPVVVPLFSPLPSKPVGKEDATAFNAWAKAAFQGGSRIFGDLKWVRDPANAGNPKLERSLRAIYLEQLLVVLLAQLRVAGVNQFSQLVATRSEAMSVNDVGFAKTYSDDLGAVIRNVCEKTGFLALAGPAPKVVSESTAAIELAGGKPFESVLAIDVGGGTTDIGIALSFGKKGEEIFAKYTTSARFAGNDLLNALSELDDVRQSVLDVGDKERHLIRESSKDEICALLKSRLRAGQCGQYAMLDGVQPLVDAFFDGVFEYAFRTLRDFLTARPDWQQSFLDRSDAILKIALMGNGFLLFGAFAGKDASLLVERVWPKIHERLVKANLLSSAIPIDKIRLEIVNDPKNGMIAHAMKSHVAPMPSDDLPRQILLADKVMQALREGSSGAPTLPLVAQDAWEKTVRPTLARFYVSPEEFAAEFPLTRSWWGEHEKELGQVLYVRNAERAKFLIDIGAIYLSGFGNKSEPCYARLLTIMAQRFANGKE